jgi:hypothetical protein
MAPDPIAAAVAATEPGTVSMATVQVTLSSGRPVVIAVPIDLTLREVVDLCGFVSSGLGPELDRRRQAASPKPRLLVPKHQLVKV